MEKPGRKAEILYFCCCYYMSTHKLVFSYIFIFISSSSSSANEEIVNAFLRWRRRSRIVKWNNDNNGIISFWLAHSRPILWKEEIASFHALHCCKGFLFCMCTLKNKGTVKFRGDRCTKIINLTLPIKTLDK